MALLEVELLDISVLAQWLWIELAATFGIREGCKVDRFV